MYQTYIPYNQLKVYLTMMIQNELIVYVKEEKKFKITDMQYTLLNYMMKWLNY
jgi:predicted transcriptional regulator